MAFSYPPHNAGRALFIVKCRTLDEHARGTISAVRRVRKFSRWQSRAYCPSLDAALAEIEQLKARGGLYDYAVFHRGKRVGRGTPAAAPREDTHDDVPHLR